MLQKLPSNKKVGKINIFLIGLLVLWPWDHTQAQASSDIHVHGHVTDRVTGEPMSGVYMELKDNAQNTLSHTNTNAGGDFDLSASKDAISSICATATTVDNRGYSVQDHIRLCKNISSPLENDLQLDMALQPAGNLIIQAYDEHGNVIRFSAFTAVTGYYVFITDLTDLPIPGVLSNVQDATSRQTGSILEMTIPSFLAPLQTPSILHILWDVPTFGRVILDLDNGGGGYSVSKKGDFLVINFNQEAAKSEVARFERELSIFTGKGYTFSSIVTSNLTPAKSALDSGNLHLLKNPPDTASAVSDFNKALVDALKGQELLYLEKAQADIPRYRQGTLGLAIKNPDGSPLAHTSITYHQTSHDFLFGGSYLTDGWNYLPQEGDLLKEAGFNQSSVAMLYEAIEPTPGTYDFSYPDQESGLGVLLAKGFIMDGELAYWAHSNDFNCPAYWKSMNFDELKQNIYNHFKALASHFGARIHLWDINEQNLPWANCTGLNWEQKLEVYQSVMDGLHAGYPAARNFVESIAMPFSWEQQVLEDTTSIPTEGIAFPVYLDLVQQHGLPIDTIGLEFYHFGVTAPPDDIYAPPGLSLASIARYMNLYNKYEKPVYILEFQVPSTQEPGSSWLHQPWTETTQAEFSRDFYTLAFGSQYMQGIQWSAMVSDMNTYITNAGLLDKDFKPKPVYYTLKDLIASWTSNGSGTTDENGKIELTGFAGDYDITVAQPDGKIWQTHAHIFEQQNTDITISPPAENIPTPTPPDSDLHTLTQRSDWSIPATIGILLLVILIFVFYWRRRRKSMKG